jgi:hypothetical protein
MVALGLVESRLRFGYRLVAPLALLGLGRELPPAIGFAPLPLLLEIHCRLPGGLFADLRRRSLRRFRTALSAAIIDLFAGGQVGVLGEAPVRSRGGA